MEGSEGRTEAVAERPAGADVVRPLDGAGGASRRRPGTSKPASRRRLRPRGSGGVVPVREGVWRVDVEAPRDPQTGGGGGAPGTSTAPRGGRARRCAAPGCRASATTPVRQDSATALGASGARRLCPRSRVRASRARAEHGGDLEVGIEDDGRDAPFGRHPIPVGMPPDRGRSVRSPSRRRLQRSAS